MTSFHVRHDFTPVHGREALLLLQTPAVDNEELLIRARAHGLELGRRRSPDKVVASLRDLGLVGRASADRLDGIQLTPLGHELAQVAKRDALLFAELVHLRYWWLWTTGRSDARFSWSYRTVSDLLWDGAPAPVDGDHLVAAVLAAAEREFGVPGASFSASSVLGILHWLRALSPPCLARGTFHRRLACAPEALVVSLEGIQAASVRPLGTPLRLDGEAREQLCRATLLDDTALDEMLAQAEDALGLLRRSGDGGDFVVLRESLVPDLVPGKLDM